MTSPELVSSQERKGASATPEASHANGERRRLPTRWQSTWLFVRSDLAAIARSWLCRGFFLASILVTIIELKGMQAAQKPASQMLETVYVTYLLVWMHGIIFIAGAALLREADCLNDAILSRGVTRGEYIVGKSISRCVASGKAFTGSAMPVDARWRRHACMRCRLRACASSASRRPKRDAPGFARLVRRWPRAWSRLRKSRRPNRRSKGRLRSIAAADRQVSCWCFCLALRSR